MPASEYSAIALVVDGTTDVDASTVNQYYRLLKGTITGDPITPAGPVRINVASATALTAGPNGVTNPSFQVDSSAASAATGIVVTAAAAASRVALAAISSGVNEGLSIDAKGSGTIRLGATSTGAIEFSRAAQPTTNDGVALGVGGTAWADLFLASAAVINFANGDVTLTHATGVLTIDLTGAATRTLTLTNSTGSQVANLDVDGRLLFRNNTSFTITLSGTPTAARVFTFPNVADDTVTLLAATQTFLTGVKTFNSSILAIRNPADTFSYTLAGAAILADRTLTLPLLAGAGTLAALELAQTWTALQSFGTNLGGTLQTAAQPNVTSLGTLSSLTMGGNISVAYNSITQVSMLSIGGTNNISCVVNTSYYFVHGGVTNTSGDGALIILYGKAHAALGQMSLGTPNAAGNANVVRVTFAGTQTDAAVTWNAAYHVGLKYGLAGVATGAFTMDGATSGVVTLTVAAAAGTWTMTLPTAVPGTTGDQLSATTAGVCSWTAAGSLREFKNILGVLDPRVALANILSTPVELWTYRRDAPSTTGDFETKYTGVVADKAPWAMHYGGRIFSPTNAFGQAVGAIQALYSDLQDALAEIGSLRSQLAALQA